MFGANLVLRRRITIDVFGPTIGLADMVENRGFRPTPHAILYHVNFGYPFLDEATQLSGDLSDDLVSAFNSEDKRQREDFLDYYQEMPVASDLPTAVIELRNSTLLGGMRARLSFSREALPSFGVWRAFQSGVYAFALEPSRRFEQDAPAGPSVLQGGETAKYEITVTLGNT